MKKTWTFNSGAGSGIHVTLNGGDTLEEINPERMDYRMVISEE